MTELDPPRRMAWAWSVNDGAWSTTVTFELTPGAGGTRLRLTHLGEMDPLIAGLLKEGWPSRIELLGRSFDLNITRSYRTTVGRGAHGAAGEGEGVHAPPR